LSLFSKPLLAWLALVSVAALAPASAQPRAQPMVASTPDCPAVKKRALEILGVLDAKATAAIQTRMRGALAKAPQSTPAKIWDQFAAVAYLQKHPDTALWAEIHAMQLSWQPDYVGHAGVYLVALKNLDDAKLFLHCSYDMGWRSPSLFEALALAYYRSGDKQRSADWIDQAEQLAPDDVVLQAEKSIVRSGNPPPLPPPGADELDAAIRGLERHLQRVAGQINAAIAVHKQLAAVFNQPQDDNDWIKSEPKWEADMRKIIANIRGYLPRARMSYADFQREIYPGGSSLSYEGYKQSFRNQVLAISAFQYSAVTVRLFMVATSLDYFQGPWKLDLWAHAMHEDLLTQARELKAAQDILQDHAVAQPPNGPAEAAYYKAYQDAVRATSGMQDQHAAQVAWCAAIIPAFQQYARSSKSGYQRAADGYNEAAKEYLRWAALEVRDARAYLLKTLPGIKILKAPANAPKNEQAMFAGYAASAELAVKQAKDEYQFILRQAAGDPQNVQSTVPFMLASGQQNFASTEQFTEGMLQSTAQTISSNCSAVAAEVLKKLNPAEAEKTREELLEELEASLGVKAEFAPNCNFNIGPLNTSIGLDVETGRFQYQVGGEWDLHELGKKKEGGAKEERGGAESSLTGSLNVTVDDRGRPTSIEGGVGVDVDADGVVGSGEVTLVSDRDLQTGKVETTAQVKAAIGVGAKEGDLGVACYPGEVSMVFHPRVVLDKAATYLKSFNATQI